MGHPERGDLGPNINSHRTIKEEVSVALRVLTTKRENSRAQKSPPKKFIPSQDEIVYR